MPSTAHRRYFPARRMLVRGTPSQILRTVEEVFAAAGFHPATAIDETTIQLEIGSAVGEFWLGETLLGDRLLRRVLPRRAHALAIHGFVVARVSPSDAADADHPETSLTVSAVDGLDTGDVAIDAIEECLAYFTRIGTLLDAGEAISGLELPVDSVCNPTGFKRWRRARRRG